MNPTASDDELAPYEQAGYPERAAILDTLLRAQAALPADVDPETLLAHLRSFRDTALALQHLSDHPPTGLEEVTWAACIHRLVRRHRSSLAKQPNCSVQACPFPASLRHNGHTAIALCDRCSHLINDRSASG